MRTERILFFLAILGIFILLISINFTKDPQVGKINTIQQSEKRTMITLDDHETPLIIFTEKYLDLEKGDAIQFEGKEETYRNQKQIIVDKIYKLGT